MQAGGLYDVKFHTHDETLKDEKHDTVDKSTSKQQVCVLDSSHLCCAKNLTHTPIYIYIVLVGLMAGQQAYKNLIVLKKFITRL